MSKKTMILTAMLQCAAIGSVITYIAMKLIADGAFWVMAILVLGSLACGVVGNGEELTNEVEENPTEGEELA